MDQQSPKTITLDLDNPDQLVNFSSEVLLRLAFFGTNGKMSKKDRLKQAHHNLDMMLSTLHKQLKERSTHYQEEYDNLGNQVQGCEVPDNSTE
jgi:hypothetical protein